MLRWVWGRGDELYYCQTLRKLNTKGKRKVVSGRDEIKKKELTIKESFRPTKQKN